MSEFVSNKWKSGGVNMKENQMIALYEELNALLSEHHDEIIEFGRKLFACPELGFKEEKTNEILTAFLTENGIPCKNDIAMTGIRADLGSGDGYHIALVADMDAIYVRDGEKTYPFHSCGHCIQTAVLAWVMKLLKTPRWNLRQTKKICKKQNSISLPFQLL